MKIVLNIITALYVIILFDYKQSFLPFLKP